MLTGLNHVTLASRDLEKSLDFYVGLLNFKLHATWSCGAYLTLGNFWLCLSYDESCPAQDYTHLAFTIAAENFLSFSDALVTRGISQWKYNKSEGDSLYILDPDGHKLEIHVGNLHSRLESMNASIYADLKFFD